MMARMRGRDLAMLGALGAAALALGKGKGKDKKFADTQDAEAGETLAGKSSGGGDTGVATQRLSDFRGKSGDADRDVGPRMKTPKPQALTDRSIADTEDQEAGERVAGRGGLPYGYTPYPTSARARDYEAELTTKLRPRGGMKGGGSVKKMAKGGSVGSASKRADGCAQRGKTKGRIV